MANEEQLAILRQGVEVWNKWRETNGQTRIDLSNADLRGTDLREANLNFARISEANLKGVNLNRANLNIANLRKSNLSKSKLSEADLSNADLSEADFSDADLSKSDLSGAYLNGANLRNADLSESDLSGGRFIRADFTGAWLRGADFSRANLERACLRGCDLKEANLNQAILGYADLVGSNLSRAQFVGTDVSHTVISKSSVYGINVWDLKGEFEQQSDLVITHKGQSEITVDNINVAQFIYLILNNEKLRDVINTVTSKSVLILGRFAIAERKAVLDALRNKLREYNLLPIVFDFDRPTDKDFTETIKTLAGLSYFVIADVTNPKSSPLELQAAVPDYQIPFVPIIQEGESPFAMMVDLQKKYPWVLPTKSYDSIETLMSALKRGIIDPAVEMRNKLRLVKAQEQVTESLRDYVDKTL